MATDSPDGVRLSDAASVQIIPLSLLTESKTNPRKAYGKDALKELALSIQAHGILEPLLVRPAGDNTFEIVAGSRRYRAAKIAQLIDVPAIVREMDDAKSLEVQIVENLQREDINALEEAQGYRKLLELTSGPATDRGDGVVKNPSIGAIATLTGKSQSYVYQRLKLLDAVKPVRALLEEGVISVQHGIRLSRLQPDLQAQIVKDLNFEDMSIRDLEEEIERRAYQSLSGAPWSKADAGLVKDAGSCNSCVKNTSHADPDGIRAFPDVKENLCTDPTCYAIKLKAHLVQRIRELKEKGTTFIRISTEYTPAKSTGLIGTNSYTEVEKAAKDAKFALVVDGYRRVGQTMYIRLSKDEHQERSIGSKPKPSPSRKRELREIKLSMLAVQEMRKLPVKTLLPQDYQAIAANLAGRYAARSWKVLRGEKLLRFIRNQVLDELESDARYRKDARNQIEQLARRYKVNMKQLELKLK